MANQEPKAPTFALKMDEDGPRADPGRAGGRVAFYEELLELERAVLAKMKELAANRPDELREAVVESNIEPLEALIQDFESRLRFWRSQASEGPAS